MVPLAMQVAHATEDADVDETLCGRPVTGRLIDNVNFTCRTCKRVVASRCWKHNIPRCKCGAGKIGVTP